MIARLLISTSLETIKSEIAKTLTSHFSHSHHPDVLYFSSDAKLGIAETRKIKEHFSLKPYSLKGRIAVLENASVLTPEAQNALLKILEELPKEALFILCANSDAYFLPTVLSRCEIIRVMGEPESVQDYKPIKDLISAKLEHRFEFIEKLKEKQEFLQAMTLYFHQNASSQKDFLKELLQAEEWASQNVNIRAILEYLMLVMPRNL